MSIDDDAEHEHNDQRTREALYVIAGALGLPADFLSELIGEELRALPKHGWDGAMKWMSTKPTIPGSKPSGEYRFEDLPAELVTKPKR